MKKIEDIVEFVDTNFTENDKFTSWMDVEKKLRINEDARIEATYKCFVEKAGRNPFKRWFYLGFGKDKKWNVLSRDTPYYKHLWKNWLKWRKNIEVKGLLIRRPYGEKFFNLHRFYNPYFYKLRLKDTFNFLSYKFGYKFDCSVWDMNSAIEYLIITLTEMGVYHALGLSHVLSAKYQMHQIWTARKMLIKALMAEDETNYVKVNAIKEKFHVSFDYFENLTMYSKKSFIEDGTILMGSDTNIGINPLLVQKELFSTEQCNTELGRELILAKCNEIDNSVLHCYDELITNDKVDYVDNAYQKILIRKAFDFISTHILEWGD